MSDLVERDNRDVFIAFTGTPTVTCAQVNAALGRYAVVSWSWAVVDNRVELSALMMSVKELRNQQLAAARMAPPPNWRPN